MSTSLKNIKYFLALQKRWQLAIVLCYGMPHSKLKVHVHLLFKKNLSLTLCNFRQNLVRRSQIGAVFWKEDETAQCSIILNF